MNEEHDAMTQVEDAKAQRDLGVFAVRVLQGARTEANSKWEAWWASVALLVATIAKPPELDD